MFYAIANIVESGVKTPEIKNQIILFSKIYIYNSLSVIHFPFDLTEKYFRCKRTWHDVCDQF
jgi:hypothetical protein